MKNQYFIELSKLLNTYTNTYKYIASIFRPRLPDSNIFRSYASITEIINHVVYSCLVLRSF